MMGKRGDLHRVMTRGMRRKATVVKGHLIVRIVILNEERSNTTLTHLSIGLGQG